jgi:hypothetical protein
MDAPSLKRAASAATMGIGGLLWLAAILSMAQTAQNSEQFSRLHPWILMVNIAGSPSSSACSRRSSRS